VGSKRPTTIAEYIQAAPREGQSHLRGLYEILKNVAPDADEAVKWGTPFFIEPRFVFAFSAHKAHCSFVPTASALAEFRKQLEPHLATKGTLKLPYSEPLPEALIRRLAERSLQSVNERKDSSFWETPTKSPAGQRNSQSKTIMKKTAKRDEGSAKRLIDARIAELGDWRGDLLGKLRALIKAADPDVVEEWKWQVPVWSHDGIICTGETYKSVVKLTFARGAAVKDSAGQFNSSLEGKRRRAIDFREDTKINEKALKTLIRAAVALNKAKAES